MTLPASAKLALKASPLLVLVLVSVWTFALQRSEMAADPSAHQWAAARQVVLDNYREHDVVRISPYWADQGRIELFEQTLDMAIRPSDWELGSYDRLWIISDLEHAAGALDELPERYTLLESIEPNEMTRVFLVDIPAPNHIVFDFERELQQASVTRVYPDRVEACDDWRDDGWHCRGYNAHFFHVTPGDIAVGATGIQHCFYTAVVPDQAVMRIEYPDVQFGSRLIGNFGNQMVSQRSDRGSDIRFQVEIDGQIRTEFWLNKWGQDFVPFEIDTNAETGSLHSVAFTVFAEDLLDRWVCWRARAMR